MFRYLTRRLLFMIPMFIGITMICFAVIHLAPGSPTDMQTQMNPKASAELKERLRSMYDLDKPLHIQYAIWMKKLVKLDLGTSFSPDMRPVAEKISGAPPDHDSPQRPVDGVDYFDCDSAGHLLRRLSQFLFRQADDRFCLYGVFHPDLLAGPARHDFFRDLPRLASHFRHPVLSTMNTCRRPRLQRT